jgi:methyl-accepting chemotaxis protein WspA
LTAAFDAMIHSLASLLNQVRQSGIKVTSTSTAISASTRQFESTVNQQAAATNQTAATSREISTRSHEANDEVEEATAMTAGTTELAEQGRRSLEVVETDMRRLMDAAGLINDKLGDISQNAAGISGIVETITKVADQTNLLSLNASIEAEKAGEYGLGFSVVAGEISRLADQTAVAAMDIEEMVAEMRETVAGGVREVEGFVEDFKSGVGEVNRINRQIADIIDRVKALEPKFEAVRAAVHAQSGGAEDISAAMGQLADSATQTKDSLDDLNQAAQDLAEAVRGLNQEVSRFEID